MRCSFPSPCGPPAARAKRSLWRREQAPQGQTTTGTPRQRPGTPRPTRGVWPTVIPSCRRGRALRAAARLRCSTHLRAAPDQEEDHAVDGGAGGDVLRRVRGVRGQLLNDVLRVLHDGRGADPLRMAVPFRRTRVSGSRTRPTTPSPCGAAPLKPPQTPEASLATPHTSTRGGRGGGMGLSPNGA